MYKVLEIKNEEEYKKHKSKEKSSGWCSRFVVHRIIQYDTGEVAESCVNSTEHEYDLFVHKLIIDKGYEVEDLEKLHEMVIDMSDEYHNYES